MSASDIPVDIIEEIVSHLDGDRWSLQALSLVARRWTYPARHYLFGTLTISPSRKPYTQEELAFLAPYARQLYLGLTNNYSLDLPWPADPKDEPVTVKPWYQIYWNLTNLAPYVSSRFRQLRLYGAQISEWPSLSDLVETGFDTDVVTKISNHITAVSTEGFTFDFSDLFTAFLKAFPNTTTLECNNSTCKVPVWTFATTDVPVSPLGSLSWKESDDTDGFSGMFNWLTRTPSAHSLHHVRVQCQSPTYFDALSALVKACTNLRELAIDMTDGSNHTASGMPGRCLSYSPACLRKLSVYQSSYPSSVLKARLSQPSTST
jgi:hypothetical protein